VNERKGQRSEQAAHPDPEALAEFQAGLASGAAGARISAHLAACGHCARLCGDLAEISALLAAVPVPALPDPVAGRLDQVLAAEAARRDHSERAGADGPQDRPAASRPHRRRGLQRVTWRVAAPAAAALVVLAAGGYGLSRIGGTPAGPTAAGTAGTAAGQRQAQAAPAARADGGPDAVPAIEAPARFLVVTSQTDYQRTTLPQQAEREVGLNARGAAGPRGPASAAVRGCVQQVTRGVSPGTIVLAETAYFQGRPALLIVAVSGPRDVAWVTSPDCAAGSGGVLAETTLPGTSAP